ncbi:MAG: VWA domain-containing protein [Nitrospirota bacterium]|jgi:hypothetical protein
MFARPVPALVVLPLISVLLITAGCGGGGGGSDPTPITVELTGDPTVEYDAVRGRTVVVSQFSARRDDGLPVTPDEVQITIEVDGAAVDNESILRESARELSASLHYYLVLDASGSMLQHDPPAFTPMKEAARRSVDAGVDAWTTRPGIFSWDVTWFNDVLFHRRGLWASSDITSIPEPPLDAATKLYAAVEQAAEEMLAAYQLGTANGLRDHHVMVVLSDGADNLSDFDNEQAVPPTVGSTDTGGNYERFGWPATSLADAIAAITAHPSLTVHVLAMGSKFAPADLDNLQALSDAGGGQLLVNPKASEVEALFDRVTREFTTVQTAGAAIPQQGGDHELTLVVEGTAFDGAGSLSFAYRAGPGAQVLPAP